MAEYSRYGLPLKLFLPICYCFRTGSHQSEPTERNMTLFEISTHYKTVDDLLTISHFDCFYYRIHVSQIDHASRRVTHYMRKIIILPFTLNVRKTNVKPRTLVLGKQGLGRTWGLLELSPFLRQRGLSHSQFDEIIPSTCR